MIYKSAVMSALFDLAMEIAPLKTTVLITGETGTGKELLAKTIHENSTRHGRSFVAINCCALPETLLESELFGHQKGSFTGAVFDKIGLFELANGGTLFLDEIGDLPISLQIKLLRALQEKEIRRVGGLNTIKIDVRVISATHRDLIKEVGEARFREDLFYRLNVFPLHIPPLRERTEDIEPLVNLFIQRLNKELGKNIEKASVSFLEDLWIRPWKGNVRELQNVIEHAMILEKSNSLQPRLPVREKPKGIVNQVAVQERAIVVKALADNGGHKGRTARSLQISTHVLAYKIKKYGI